MTYSIWSRAPDTAMDSLQVGTGQRGRGTNSIKAFVRSVIVFWSDLLHPLHPKAGAPASVVSGILTQVGLWDHLGPEPHPKPLK